MKTCSKCKETKELTEYHKDKNSKDRLCCMCKVCACNISKHYYENNKEKATILNKKWKENNKEKVKESRKKWRDNNPEKLKEWYELNKDKYKQYWDNRDKSKLKEQRKNFYLLNKDRIRLRSKIYRDSNKEKIKEYRKGYYQKNKQKINKKIRIRRNSDQFLKLKSDIRSNISNAINRKGYTKRSRTHEILGCSYKDFKTHIERQFTKGMNWDNRDKWHIDHIIPMATAKTEEDVIRLNHYTNLRPLWAEENLSKSDKIITHQLVLL
jgi:hypothetical protein